MTALDLNQCLNQIQKRNISLHTCTPISDLPSTISTMKMRFSFDCTLLLVAWLQQMNAGLWLDVVIALLSCIDYGQIMPGSRAEELLGIDYCEPGTGQKSWPLIAQLPDYIPVLLGNF